MNLLPTLPADPERRASAAIARRVAASPGVPVASVALVVLASLASTAHAAATDAPLDDACWSPSFVEEFDALSLHDDASGEGRWRTRYIWGRDTIINREKQYYLDPREHALSPFEVDDGILSIVARRTPDTLEETFAGQPYVSGVLTTERSFAQRHGRFEARARVPGGRGLWSALWLLPSFERWPEGVAVLPEIDIMEFLGHTPRTLHTTLHTNQSGALTSHGYEHRSPVGLDEDFHLYSVTWTPETVRWYLDRELVASHPTPADFTRPVHFLLNLAVGGGWPGDPDATTRFPARYEIDHVRAWEDNGRCD